MTPVSGQRYNYEKLVLENVSDIIITTDLHFVVHSWNFVAEHYYQVSEEAAIGRRMNELVTFTYLHADLEQAVTELQQNKIWQGEVSFINKKGETFYFFQTVKYALNDVGEEIGILAVGRNITDKKKAEQKLRESEQFYRELIADSLDAVVLMNAEGTITFASPSIKTLLGYGTDEVIGTNGFGYIHPEDVAFAIQSFEKEVEENPEIKFIVVRLLKKTGEWLWCMARGHNLLSNPCINSIAVYIHDDTPRKQATDALKESEKRFRTLIRDLRIGVLLQDKEGKVIMTNNTMINTFELTEEQIIDGKIWELYQDVIHEDGTTFLQSERPSFRAIQTCEPVQDVVMGVWHEGRKERIWIMISADPILDTVGNLVNIVCSFTDITERKKLEKKSVTEKIAYQRQIAQATIDGQEKERLEIGKELHDNIGQQLTTIKLYLDFVKTTVNTESNDMVNMALKGISEVINEVRTISRSLVPPSLKDLGFIDSVNDLIDALRTAQAVAIELDYFGFDEDQLPENKKLALFRIIQEQLNNITKHAAAKNIGISITCTDENVLLRIKDDGNGFDLSNIRRGLGLTNIINRAELFGGKVDIVTSPGKGCKLKVLVPHAVTSAAFE
jgi:PAS domain S-box-containing protein